MDKTLLLKLARRGLAEDRAGRDLTSRMFVPARARGRAVIVANRPGVLAGGPMAQAVFEAMGLSARGLVKDGARVRPGQKLLAVQGPLRAILSAERTALNFLTHLSGIATLTRRCVDAAGPGGPAVLETRKTLPGLRDLQKYAVRMGGGKNHRRDLSDAVLIKENHLAFFSTPGGRSDLVRRVKRVQRSGRWVEMECRNRSEILWALEAGADILLLDNIPVSRLKGLVHWIRRECGKKGRMAPSLEVSGGVTPEMVPRLARAGIDRISIGRLTHSAPALDMSLDVTVL
ncbi:MAG: carboxylating nicotinate-nucleotide diphosphorylase [Elusimicrobia bacterium]|nr:carboxylating nicotinate-nucleotide diphosphorylase [Elusimicrobiota bacterium]